MEGLDKEDPRVVPGICGVIFRSGNYEWICVKKPHANIYRKKRGGIIFDNNPTADRHYFVNRWPNRSKKES